VAKQPIVQYKASRAQRFFREQDGMILLPEILASARKLDILFMPQSRKNPTEWPRIYQLAPQAMSRAPTSNRENAQ
jgi:hypothetical protein